MARTNSNLVAYGWMVGAAFSFASMGTLAHGLRDQFGWEVIALARSAVIVILSGLLLWGGGMEARWWRPSALWVRSIAGTVSMFFVFYSFTRLPVAIVVTLVNLAPAWVAILSGPLLKHRVGKGVWLATLLGVAGVGLIQQPQLSQGNFAALAPLVSSVCIAIVMISLHRLQSVEHRVIVFHFAVVSLVGCLAAAVVVGLTTKPELRMPVQPTGWLMLVGVGVAATAGQLFLTAAFSRGTPARVSIAGLTQVGFAMAYDVLLWDHAFDILSLLGIVLVVAPTAWLLLAERRLVPRGPNAQ